MLLGAHHVIFLISLIAAIADDALIAAWFYLFSLLFLAPLIYFSTKLNKTTSRRIRYNRQAQLIHIDDGQGHVAHIPWRHVRPVVDYRHSGQGALHLYAPRPRAEQEAYGLTHAGNSNPPAIDFAGPYCCGSAFSIHLHGLQGLEFVRRYMEHGLKAIGPTTAKPVKDQQPNSAHDAASRFCLPRKVSG